MTNADELIDLPGIPYEARELWTRLLAEEPMPLASLRSELNDYNQSIVRKTRVSEDIDPTLARALVQAARRMLDLVDAGTPEETRRLIQAAVRYFILEEDAESDLDTVLGLDDDAAVMNAVARHIGKDDWVVDIV